MFSPGKKCFRLSFPLHIGNVRHTPYVLQNKKPLAQQEVYFIIVNNIPIITLRIPVAQSLDLVFFFNPKHNFDIYGNKTRNVQNIVRKLLKI